MEGRLQVTVVRGNRQAVLVEALADGRLQRRIVPAGAVTDSTIADEIWEQGIPYGEPWAQIARGLALEGVPERLEEALQQRGVWTLEDARLHPMEVIAALQQALGLERARFMRLVEKWAAESPKESA